MVDPKTPNLATSALRGASPADLVRPAEAQDPARGIAFRALLEQLDRDARALEQHSTAIRDAEELAGAVDRAGTSLQDALSLGDRLLEAYRATLARSEGPRSARGG
jgi:hypothetical protein